MTDSVARIYHELTPEMMEAIERSADKTQAWLDCMWGIVDASGRSARICALARYFAEAETTAEIEQAERIYEELVSKAAAEGYDDYEDNVREEAVIAALCPGMTKMKEHLASALADAAERGARELGHPKPDSICRRDG
jgi:hypothetical protein